MVTLAVLLLIAAFVVTVLAAIGKAPLWVAVVLLCVLDALRVVPIG